MRIVKHVYKVRSREPENVPMYEQLSLKYRLKLYALKFIKGKNENSLYKQ
jgi:hypothetical protein